MRKLVNNNSKKGEKSTTSISFQVKESNYKEAEDLFEAVPNIYIYIYICNVFPPSELKFLFVPI